MNPRSPFATSLALLLVLTSAPAIAEMTKAQCVDANTAAQSLRRDGKLAEARGMLAVCGDPGCAALVRDDCTRRLDELEAAQPTVVFDAKDGRGADRAGVRVSVDGRALADKLDGSPLAVDPGEHTFVFEAPGETPVTLRLVLKEAEKGRRERVVIGAPVAGPAGPPTPAASHGSSTQRTLGIAGMGLGAAALAVGGVFGILTATGWNTTKGECGSPQVCPNYVGAVRDHATVVTDGTVSTASLIAGAVLLVGGGALFFTAGPTAVAPEVAPTGASLTVKGRF